MALHSWCMNTMVFLLTGDDISKNTIDYSAATNKLLPGDMKIKDVSGDGKINADDRVRLEKNRDPWFTGGMNISPAIQNFDCSILVQGATGGLLFIGTESGTAGNFLQYSYDHRWTVENPAEPIPVWPTGVLISMVAHLAPIPIELQAVIFCG